MDSKPIESQSRLLLELGEPESWLEAMLRASRREALHAATQGHEELAKRWRRLERALDYASAANSVEPFSEGRPSESAQGETQAQVETDKA